MYLRKANGYELWGSLHPVGIGCLSDGRAQCQCKYHIVNEKRSEIYSFEEYKKADTKFQELTGVEPFVLGKSRW